MVKKSQLAIVDSDTAEKARLEKEAEETKLTRDEIRKRVHEIRLELEAARARYDGAFFGSFTDGIPRSLDVVDVNREPFGAVNHLSPFLQAWVETLQQGKVRQCFSDDVFELYYFSTETAFHVGMLAGAIFTDNPTATIDRLERGLVTALSACHWIIKEEERSNKPK